MHFFEYVEVSVGREQQDEHLVRRLITEHIAGDEVVSGVEDREIQQVVFFDLKELFRRSTGNKLRSKHHFVEIGRHHLRPANAEVDVTSACSLQYESAAGVLEVLEVLQMHGAFPDRVDADDFDELVRLYDEVHVEHLFEAVELLLQVHILLIFEQHSDLADLLVDVELLLVFAEGVSPLQSALAQLRLFAWLIVYQSLFEFGAGAT